MGVPGDGGLPRQQQKINGKGSSNGNNASQIRFEGSARTKAIETLIILMKITTNYCCTFDDISLEKSLSSSSSSSSSWSPVTDTSHSVVMGREAWRSVFP